ncbi:hypothetical protein [Actinotignum urinale]|uniref:hypothetical protein n=1 Tax=Actinotignum urinale TaxID=190146 RepID=UPI00370D2800
MASLGSMRTSIDLIAPATLRDADLADYRGAIAEALQRGTRRDILTEPAPKAPQADA